MTRSRSWVLTVLVVLIGLFGMHALSSEHNSMARMAAHESISIGASASAAVSETITALSGAHPAGSLAAPVAFAAPVVLTVTDTTAVMSHPLCVAVLTATVLLLLLGHKRRSERPSVPQILGSALCWAAALWRPGPPDLVAGLCVSRT